MTLTKRERVIFVITVAIITAAASYNFIIEPFFKRWKAFNNEINIKKITLKKGIRLLKDRNAIISDYNKYTSSIKNASKLLSYIEKEAGSSGVKIADAKPMPAAQKGDHEEYIIELKIEGSFSAINKFLSSLIQPPKFITVNKFDLRAIEENSPYLKGTLILSKILI